MSGLRWEQCLVFGRLMCCALPPRSYHKMASHKPRLCKLTKLILLEGNLPEPGNPYCGPTNQPTKQPTD
jgi:hypothetical protein